MESHLPPEYYSPTYLDEALDLMSSRRLDLVAGGTDFYPARGRSPVTRDILDKLRILSISVNAELPPCIAARS